jgi:hypothetical protein
MRTCAIACEIALCHYQSMTFCPYCNQFTSPSHCQVPRCGGFVCGTCGQCNRMERFHRAAGQREREAMPRTARITDTVLNAAGVALLGAMCVVSAGCASGHAAAIHHKAQSAPAPSLLSTLAACQKLRADVVANGGTPDKPTLEYLVSHAASTRVAFLVSQAAQDVGNAKLLFSPGLVVLEGLCARQGVQIAG